MSPASAPKIRSPAYALAHGAAFVAWALVVYARALPLGFVSDVFDLVERIANGPVFVGWGGFFRPVTVASLSLDHAVFGAFAPAFHATNVVLHGLCGALIASLVEHLLQHFAVRSARPVAVLSALSFIAMPSHTEAVTWVAGRGDVLATFFGLASLNAFTRAATPIARWSCPMLAALAFLSKESAVALPPTFAIIAVAMSRAHGAPISRETKRVLVVVSLVFLCYLALRAAVLTEVVGGYGVGRLLPTDATALSRAIGRSFFRTFVPATSILRGDAGAIALALVAALAFAITVTTRVRPRSAETSSRRWFVASMIACFLVAIAPTLMIGINLGDTMGERFLYLPSAFLVALPILGIFERPGAKYARALCIAAIALQAIALDRVNVRWQTASALSNRVLDDLVTRDMRTTALLNLPDNHRGAYLFRNGLGPALVLRGAPPGTNVPLVLHDVDSPERAYSVTRHDTTLELTLGARDDVVRSTGESVRVGTDGRSLSIDLTSLPATIDTLLVFEGGARVLRAFPVGVQNRR